MKNKYMVKDTLKSVLTKIVLITVIPFQVMGSSEDESVDEIDRGARSGDISAQEQQRHGYVANEVIVRLKQGVDSSIIETIGSAHGVMIIGEIPQLNVYLLRLPHKFGVERAIRAYGEHPDVQYAEPNYLGRGGEVVPDDTFFLRQWHLNNTGQSGGSIDADIDAIEGWQITRGHESITVAVLDTGILSDHPEFVGRVLPGWDFVNDDNDPTSDHPHGLYVTGLLAANADNTFGVAGVDHGTLILPVKVLDEANLGSTFNLVQGLVFAADQGADVVNMSLIDYPRERALRDALAYARDAGSVLIACAGNGGLGDADRSWPGASPLTVSVGATDHNDTRAYFSGTGDALDVVAPGRSVITVYNDISFDWYTYFSGCSAATPIVSGIASLLLSLNEDLTHGQIDQLLKLGAEDQVGPEDEDTLGRDDFYGFGRVNLADTLSLATAVLPISIDIDPDSDRNRIRPSSRQEVEVAILGDSGFDVTSVNCESLGFGPAKASALECEIEDENDDGIDDLVAEFIINETGIACGDTYATLVGQTLEGTDLIGVDTVTTVGCGEVDD